MHVMIDLETLGTKPDAVIGQIGAVGFELASGGRVYTGERMFNRYVNIDSCLDKGMSINGNTVGWWLLKDKDAREQMATGIMETSVPLEDALTEMIEWPGKVFDMNWAGIEGVWAHPSVFDIAILNTAFGRCKMFAPWDRRNVYDTRTVYLLAGGQPETEDVGTSHNAVNDCVYQICQLQKALQLMHG